MKERHKSICAVFLILTRMNNDVEEILLQKRQNTGYMDGKYDTGCSGHLDSNESIMTALIREAKEELGIVLKEENLDLVAVVHDFPDNYIRFFFKTNRYEGTPTIMEPEKCSELVWVKTNSLPEDTIPHVKSTIENIINGLNYDDGSFSYSKMLQMMKQEDNK